MLSRHRRDGVIVLAARVGSKDEAGWLIRQMGRTRADLNTLRNRVDLHIGAGVQNSTTTDPHFILPPAYEPEASPRIGAARPEVRSGTIGERPSLTLSFGAGHPELEKIAEDVKKVAKIHSIDIVLKQLPQQEVANQIKAGAGWDLLLHYMIGYSDESASLFRVYTPQLYYNIWAGEDGRWTYTPEHEGDRVPAGLRPHTVGELLHCYESIAVSLFTVKGAGAECPVTVEQMEDALSELSKATRQSPHPYLVLGFPPMYVAATGGQEATWHAETPSRGYGDGVFSNHVKFGWPRPKAGAARGARASSK
jgi:hypothetical protein